MRSGVVSAWLLLIAGLALWPLCLALLVRSRLFSARHAPLDLVLVWTPVAFAAWVHPALGLLAALGAFWWQLHGWTRAAGGAVWPLVAMGLFLGTRAPEWAWHAAVAGLLALGVFQSVAAVSQWWGLRWIMAADPHGTVGHRTGLGIYLALLTPLAFLVTSPWSWILVGIYAAGLLVARSAVASGAALAGLVVVRPELWLWALLLGSWGFFYRLIEWSPIVQYPSDGWPFLGRRWHLANLEASWSLRRGIWVTTWRKCWPFPFWLVGHGPGAFQQDGRTWTWNQGLKEVYREAHCDYLEFFYEHGLIGMVAMGALLGMLTPALALRDPLTGVAAAFGTAMAANFPVKVMTLAGVALVVAIGLARRVGAFG